MGRSGDQGMGRKDDAEGKDSSGDGVTGGWGDTGKERDTRIKET